MRSSVWKQLHVRDLRLRIVVLIVLAMAPFSQSAQAHGGGTPRLVNAGDGPYRIFVWTQPEPLRAGEIHVSIAITEPPPEGTKIDDTTLSNDLESVVQNAEITLRLTPADDPNAAIEVFAAASTVSEFYYEADFRLPTEGMWTVHLAARADAGTSRAEFQADVLPARQINWMLLGGGVALFMVLVVGVGFSARRGSKEA